MLLMHCLHVLVLCYSLALIHLPLAVFAQPITAVWDIVVFVVVCSIIRDPLISHE